VEAILGRQEFLDCRFDRKAENAGIEDRFVLDDDDVGIVGSGSSAISLRAKPLDCHQECGSISEAMKVE
jgi:hypothetical protein